MRKFIGVLAVTAVFLIAMSAGAARADITFTLGNVPQADEENILFNEPGLITSGLTVQGMTQTTSTIVDFTSNETLTTPSSGQARVEAADGSFTELTVALHDGDTFGDLIINPIIVNPAGGGDEGELTVTVIDNNGDTSTFTYTLGTGNNFLTIVAINGQSIESVSLSATVGIGLDELDSLKQPRISGIGGGGGTTQVPVPAAILLLGSGLLAATTFARRKVK